MSAVAVIRERNVVVAGEKSGRPYTQRGWVITWHGTARLASSGISYPTSRSAAEVARVLGAESIDILPGASA